MSSQNLPKIAAACFILGLALLFAIDLGVARAVGVVLAFIGIALGVGAIASPDFLERDRGA